MRERLETVAHDLGFECPNHNTVVLEALNFCNHCIEQMEITARLALAAFGETKITETDHAGGKTNGEKGKEGDNGSRKHAGHLVVPMPNTTMVSRAN